MEFRKRRWCHWVPVALSLVVLGLAFAAASASLIGALFGSPFTDKPLDRLCDELPSEAEARRILQEHQDVVEEIEAIIDNRTFCGIPYWLQNL